MDARGQVQALRATAYTRDLALLSKSARTTSWWKCGVCGHGAWNSMTHLQRAA